MTCPPAKASSRPNIMAGTLVGTAAKSPRKKSSIMRWMRRSNRLSGRRGRPGFRQSPIRLRFRHGEAPVDPVLADQCHPFHIFGGAALHHAKNTDQFLEPVGKTIREFEFQNHLWAEHAHRPAHVGI